MVNQVINWKLACVPMLKPITGHSEPRVFKFERKDKNDAKSPVVLTVKLHMATVPNEAYFPAEGWEVWKSLDRPTVGSMTFLPKKKIDIIGLKKSLAFLKKKKWIPKEQFLQVVQFIKTKSDQNDRTCDKCMAFRALQLTHKSSKVHTDDERIKHRRVRDKIVIEFDKHLLDDRKSHDIPELTDCWPIGHVSDINREVVAVHVSDTDSQTDSEEKLEDDELYADTIGKEVMTVGRVQYAKLKPLKLGNMIVVYAVDKKDPREFFVGKAFAWKKDGGNKKLVIHWHGHKGNEKLQADERKYYAGERVKHGTEHEFWILPKHNVKKNQEWTEVIEQSSLVYWSDSSFLTVKGLINKKKLPRILARVEYVKDNLDDVL
jgi:hypothetical protein